MIEVLDVLDKNGIPTTKVKLRDQVHKDGDWHASIHVWIVSGRDVLLQKRSHDKESFPGCYDATVAGHIISGENSLKAALRECNEEMGVSLNSSDVTYIGRRRLIIENPTTGFISREFNDIYVVKVCEYIEVSLDKDEIDSIMWMNLDDLFEKMWIEIEGDMCVSKEEIEMIINSL